jgi:hypothetical protein
MAWAVIGVSVAAWFLYQRPARERSWNQAVAKMAMFSVDTILTEPIGVVGWALPKAYIYDESGLTDRRMLGMRRSGPGWYTRELEALKPNWIFVRGDYFNGHGDFGASLPARVPPANYQTILTVGIAGSAIYLARRIRHGPG